MFAGTMMGFPLTINHLVERGRALFPEAEVVSRNPDKSVRFQTYEEPTGGRSASRALSPGSASRGDRVATLCCNHAQHLECYLGVPAMGAVLHTLNLRLHPSELVYIANHARDVAVVVDRSLLPLFEKFRGALETVKHVLVVADDGGPVGAPDLDYEALLAAESAAPHGPGFTPPAGPFAELPDENAAAMICYTSGTTGHPQGGGYSHRSTV